MGDPVLFAFRVGVVLLVVAALAAVPAAVAARLAPLGRASLAVYALHVPLVYGWSTHPGIVSRIGPSLGAGASLALALAVLVGSLALARAAALAWRYRPSARAVNSTARASAQ
jgi:surface polysaccharide O-acyltransferase-like enzyme